MKNGFGGYSRGAILGGQKIPILDHGYIKYIEHWGADYRIIEAARMSTDKGFMGWERETFWCCPTCPYTLVNEVQPWVGAVINCPNDDSLLEIVNDRSHAGDEKLLRYLYQHKHATPFEMAGAIFEIQAPIFVFREWHRHRTQSYNEMSARYTPLPDLNYCPDVKRTLERARVAATTTNRQASASGEIDEAAIQGWLAEGHNIDLLLEQYYQRGLAAGVPKEIARIRLAVNRYSRMRASANLRNWLAFMTLRSAPNAQEEIRLYSNKAAQILELIFPRTMALWTEFDQKR
jgi:thymidylate synthase (FAD)